MGSFYQMDNKLLQLNPTKDVLILQVAFYIMKKENLERVNKKSQKGLFKISVSEIENTFKISRTKAHRVLKKLEDMEIIRPIAKAKSRGNESVYAYNAIYAISEEKPKKESKDNGCFNVVFDLWNSKGITKHRVASTKMIAAYKKARKEYSDNEIVKAINNYDNVLKDKDYYYSYKFTLENFLKQGNALPGFVDEGQHYINYLDKKKATTDNSDVKKVNYSSSIRNKSNKYTQSCEIL